jgi:uncharacterized membrane protein YesL
MAGSRAAAPATDPADLARLVTAALAPVALWIVLVVPLTAAIFGDVRDVVAHEHPEWRDLIAHARAHFARAVRLGAVQVIVTLILVTDVLFFMAQPAAGLKLAGFLFLYPLLFWLLCQQYQWPLLVEQRPAVWSTVKKSALLVLDNLGFSLVLGLTAGAITVACLMVRVGLPLLWAGSLAFLYTHATRALLRRYGVLPPEPEPEGGDDRVWRMG